MGRFSFVNNSPIFNLLIYPHLCFFFYFFPPVIISNPNFHENWYLFSLYTNITKVFFVLQCTQTKTLNTPYILAPFAQKPFRIYTQSFLFSSMLEPYNPSKLTYTWPNIAYDISLLAQKPFNSTLANKTVMSIVLFYISLLRL